MLPQREDWGAAFEDYVDALDCPLCYPARGAETPSYPHCCVCGADGSTANPNCICRQPRTGHRR